MQKVGFLLWALCGSLLAVESENISVIKIYKKKCFNTMYPKNKRTIKHIKYKCFILK